jgi:hypothetical protein
MDEERYTLSSLIRKLLTIQDKIKEFYEKAAKESEVKLSNLFSLFYKEYEEINKKLIEAMERTITEFVLEPIYNLKIGHHINNVMEIISNKDISNHEKAKHIEKEIMTLYDNISDKIKNLSPEISNLLANENKKARLRLEKLKNFYS